MNSSITCISDPKELDFIDDQWTMSYLTSKPEGNILRLIVSPFDDLKDGFYRLCCGYENMMCVSHIALIDIVSMFEEIYSKKFDYMEVFIIGYLNFDIAIRNAANQNPLLETISHLNSFIVTQKFNQIKKSLASILEFYVMAEDYARIQHSQPNDIQEYTQCVKESLKIYLINMEDEKEKENYYDQ